MALQAPVAVDPLEPEPITEDSPDAAALASASRPPTPDLALAGTPLNVGSRAAQLRALAAQSRHDDAVSTPGESSASSCDSGAVIHERPKSRGGEAFDMTFAAGDARAHVPARLQALQQRSRREELTVDELKRKLEAAEMRRTSYEQALKDRLSKACTLRLPHHQ